MRASDRLEFVSCCRAFLAPQPRVMQRQAFRSQDDWMGSLRHLSSELESGFHLGDRAARHAPRVVRTAAGADWVSEVALLLLLPRADFLTKPLLLIVFIIDQECLSDSPLSSLCCGPVGCYYHSIGAIAARMLAALLPRFCKEVKQTSSRFVVDVERRVPALSDHVGPNHSPDPESPSGVAPWLETRALPRRIESVESDLESLLTMSSVSFKVVVLVVG